MKELINYNKYKKIFYNINDQCLMRKPTKSNLLDFAGSDNDFYFGNINNSENVDIICKVLDIISIEDDFNKKIFNFNFYNADVPILANINNQGRINLRILGKERFFGLIKYYEGYLNKNINIENIFVVFDFKNKLIKFIEE